MWKCDETGKTVQPSHPRLVNKYLFRLQEFSKGAARGIWYHICLFRQGFVFSFALCYVVMLHIIDSTVDWGFLFTGIYLPFLVLDWHYQCHMRSKRCSLVLHSLRELGLCSILFFVLLFPLSLNFLWYWYFFVVLCFGGLCSITIWGTRPQSVKKTVCNGKNNQQAASPRQQPPSKQSGLLIQMWCSE